MFQLETISPRMLDYYVHRPGVCIIDLREPESYKEGHISGAINLPYREDRCILPPREPLVILYCDRGNVSLLCGRELAKRGYTVRSVVGGIHGYKGQNLVI
ncbi:MAG: rhodanese-like domain-containing protein [Lachnospiraceae bacterium]|nr:rhodanese-like domain-containing protein [Lachnospiraceae bacterium]MDD3616210.1 rhodanese-like domain-containing protein [Lachnospiraceae bacterium]